MVRTCADAQWVRNVLASGGCALLTRGRRLELDRPRLFRDPARRAVPRPIRVVLRLLDVADFLELWPARRARSDAVAPEGAGATAGIQ